ncbi:MAG: hypothetical protein ACO323_01595 [Candidatus Kapaibacteriota bacterium]
MPFSKAKTASIFMDFVNCLDGEGKLGKNRKNRADKGLCKQEMIATQKQKNSGKSGDF